MSSAQSISDNAAVEFYYDVGAPTYDLGGSLDTNKEKYVPAYFKFEQKLTSASSTGRIYRSCIGLMLICNPSQQTQHY